MPRMSPLGQAPRRLLQQPPLAGQSVAAASPREALKRAVDILGSAVGLSVAAIPMAVVAMLVAVDLGRPVLFRQRRPGCGEVAFEMIKFRTMRDAPPGSPPGFGDAARLTPLGRFLRASSLDELPELWNVLRGDMSLVGPRPLLMQYLPLYTTEQGRRHEVRPGVTGWAQVNGRNAIGWDDKFALDVWYVDHRSFWLDLKIIWMTVGKLFDRKSISADGHATMPLFTGSGAPASGADGAG